MRKVLFVIQNFELGGTPMVFLRLINGLDRRRFAPQLALMNARGGLLSSLPGDCEVFDLKKGPRRGFPLAVRRYAALEARLKPDVVVSALPNANILCCLAHTFRRAAPPHIVTEHAPHISYLGDRRHKFTPFAVRRLYRSAARIVTVSDGLKNELSAFYALPADKLKRIYNPVDVAAVQKAAQAPVETALPPGPVIVSVGRLAEEKAPGDILTAFSLLKPETGASLVFVGDGPLRPGLEATVSQLGLSRRVVFVGSDANPFRWMARADVFVSASIFEAFALTIAEAMAVGVPVVATDCPCGPRELLRDGRCGILVPPRHSRQLADAIDTLLADKARARDFVTAGKMRALDFDQPKIVAEYESLIEDVSCR